MSTTTRTDEELMAQLCQGVQDALTELVHRYQNDIFRFCMHYLRDIERSREMAQETFVRVYVARVRFDAERRFRPWVLCIARNLCLNELKRKKAVPMESLEEYATTARDEHGEVLRSPLDGADEAMVTAERHAWLHQALSALDAESREIVVLRFFERMAAKDIAEIVSSTEGAVRTRLHRILKSMRDGYLAVKDDL